MPRTAQQKAEFKHKAVVETKKILVIAAYLLLVLTSMEIYKAYILGEPVVVGFKFGYNAIEALLFAKVVLIGDLLNLGKRFRGYPAIVPTVAKALIFAVFVSAFSVLEVVVEKLFHGADLAAALRAVVALDRGTMAVHIALMFFNFIPLFASWESARVMGEEKFIDLFFTRPKTN